MTDKRIMEAEAALPGLDAEDDLRKGIHRFDPKAVWDLAMLAYDDEKLANDLACRRAEQIRDELSQR